MISCVEIKQVVDVEKNPAAPTATLRLCIEKILSQLSTLNDITVCVQQAKIIKDIEATCLKINTICMVAAEISSLSNNTVFNTVKNNSECDFDLYQRLFQTIEHHIDNAELNIDILSRELGVSRTGLYRKCQAMKIGSINQLIGKIRLEKAFEIIITSNYSLSEICPMVGFKDEKYFKRKFKELFNVSPKALRNMLV